MKAWGLLFSSDEASKSLVKSRLLISYGDEYMMDHGQKTVQPGAPAVEGRWDEEGYTQCKHHSLPLFLITVLVIMSGGDRRSSEEGFGCYHYCCPASSASCLDNRNHLYPAEVEEKRHLLHQPTEDQHMWTAEPCLL